METNRVIDQLFLLIRSKAQRAIAFSNDEKTRMELLSLLEEVAQYEITLHKSINDTSNIHKILVSPSSDLTTEVLSEMGAVTEIIEINEE